MVGSVIVHNNLIIGEGWHYQAGQPHAEVNAIHSVKDKSLLKEATIYVSLEPCSHFGKTPPCANLIIEHQIPNVVIGCVDSFSEVSGKGIEKLEKNGCKVSVGILEEECKALNKRFFTYHTKKRPHIILKWGETNDGFISPHLNPLPKEGEAIGPVWITNTYSRQLVHKLRTEEQAILVGTNTAITDNPKLNCRTWKGNNPVRIVLDSTLRTPKNYHLFDNTIKTIVITNSIQTRESKTNLVYEVIDFSGDVASQICNVLYKHQLQSVIIEGGSKTLQSFIDKELWDEAHIFKGVPTFSEGIKAPEFKGTIAESIRIKEDTLTIYTNKSIHSM